jgi:hypothetical protein
MANTEECAICYESITGTNKVILECGHIFHFSCILQSDRADIKSCPLCRRKMYSNDMPQSFSELFTKVIMLRSHASECSGKRKIKATIQLLDTLIEIAERYGDSPLVSSLDVKISTLRNEFITLGYPTNHLDEFEERVKRINR